MKIQYASDLHLEFGSNSVYLNRNRLLPVGEVLVLAGDMGYLGDESYIRHPFWDWASDNFERVIVIPGNHELYHSFDINELCNGWELEIRHNIKCVYNSVISLDDKTDLIATTLWGAISPYDAYLTEQSVNDFHRIRNGDTRLTWERFNEEHYRCKQFMEYSMATCKAKHIIVATHHVPSYELMSEEFKGSAINGAFAVELGDFIADSRINYWIYGHSHRNINKTIGTTQCISNQLGYVHLGEHSSFHPDAVVEIIESPTPPDR